MKQLCASIALLACVAVLAFLFSFGTTPSIHYSEESPSFNREYWLNQFTTHGPRETYQLFKEKNALAPFERQHVATHVIGELLFETEGTGGIEFCDSDFGFGCYHGFFGRAVSSEGSAVIPKLDTACVEVYGALGTGCQHGIGHGIMEYVGGGQVNEALELCEETTQLTKLLGCTSGVFMEYNTPLAGIGVDEAPVTREFNSERPYEPCTKVDDAYKESCYFELGQWYAVTFGHTYEKERQLCSGVLGDIYRKRCFMGLGALFAPVFGYDRVLVNNACSEMGKEGELFCRAGASWSFYADPSVREHAPALCAVSDASQQDTCLLYADLTEGLEQK